MERDFKAIFRYKCSFYAILEHENGIWKFVDIHDGEIISFHEDDAELRKMRFVGYEYL